jgi:hypothetical protein
VPRATRVPRVTRAIRAVLARRYGAAGGDLSVVPARNAWACGYGTTERDPSDERQPACDRSRGRRDQLFSGRNLRRSLGFVLGRRPGAVFGREALCRQ